MLQPENWWHFSQQVRAEAKLYRVPPYPEIGFLLLHRNRALRIMCEALRSSHDPADVAFVQRLDKVRFEQFKTFAVVFSQGKQERLVRIEQAKSLPEIQQVFIEVLDDSVQHAHAATGNKL
jgi:hypothetical protein